MMAEAASCSVSAEFETGEENNDYSASTDSDQLEGKASKRAGGDCKSNSSRVS